MQNNENLNIKTPIGFKFSGIHCGLKKNPNKNDLSLIYSLVPCTAAGVYTQNIVKGAPLVITKEHLSNNQAQAIITNSGNANTCTGTDGLLKAKETAIFTGDALGIDPSDILVASTGIIGIPLDLDKIKNGVPSLIETLDEGNFTNAVKGIMTTDTQEKHDSIQINIDGKTITIYAMVKGSGMIHPNMATMLSFITTDISISPNLLNEALKEAVNISYNRISVDGDSSTNDMTLILANGMAGNTEITTKDFNYQIFVIALNFLNTNLAKKIAKDGEGATKLITCTVKGASSIKAAETLGKSVINSSLVKTAIFGSDANWGRILCALGYSNIEFNPNLLNVTFASSVGEILVYQNGLPIDFDESKAKEILLKDEVEILIDLKDGKYKATCWGCDLSYEYVRINGDYRS